MSDFVKKPLQKRLNQSNFYSRVERLERAVITPGPTQRVDQLRDIANAADNVYQDRNRVYVVTDTGEERDLGEGNPVPYYRMVPACTDCLDDGTGALSPFTASAIGSGTAQNVAGETNHPGILRFTNNSATNGGGRIVFPSSGQNTLLLQGGEVYECIFRPQSFATQSIYYLGFMDTTTTSNPTDGVYVRMVGDGVTNVTPTAEVMNNGVASGSGSGSGTFSLTPSSWYRLRIEIASGASEVYFTCYSSAGLLFEYTIVGGIPTSTGRETSVATKAWRTNNTNTVLLDIDRIDFYSYATLNRFA